MFYGALAIPYWAELDLEHIMRLGGWESLDMVLRYTRSVKFKESLKLYRGLKGWSSRSSSGTQPEGRWFESNPRYQS